MDDQTSNEVARALMWWPSLGIYCRAQFPCVLKEGPLIELRHAALEYDVIGIALCVVRFVA